MSRIDGRGVMILAATLLIGGGAGCGDDLAGDLCEKACDCSSCTDSQLDECEDQIDVARDTADERGCGEPYDDYLACVVGALECDDQQSDFEAYCPDEKQRTESCLQ